LTHNEIRNKLIYINNLESAFQAYDEGSIPFTRSSEVSILDNQSRLCDIIFMRQVLTNIEAGKLTEELKRRGIPSYQRLRVVVESLEDDPLPITAINAAGGAFAWLAEEPEIYSDADLVERYRE
jgi:hypothetical protein